MPVVLDLAERASRRASPSAFIIDFTNPVGIVTRALLTAGHRAVGLCNVAIGFQRDFASLLGVEAGRVSLGHVGLNHLTWERSVLLDGVDVLPELLAKHADEIAPHTGMPADFIRHLGMVPSSYLRYYYDHDAVVESLRGATTRAEEVARLEAELLELYADPAAGHQAAAAGPARRGVVLRGGGGPARLAHRRPARRAGGEHVQPRDAAVPAGRRGDRGTGRDRVRRRRPGARSTPFEPLLRGLIAHVYAYEELALDAALRGGRDRVYDALLAHPLVGQADTGTVPDRPADRGERVLPFLDLRRPPMK